MKGERLLGDNRQQQVMADQQWMSRFERVLLAYFQIQWVQVVNLIFYFIVQIMLFIFLTLLPIKLTYHWLLVDIDGVNSTIEIFVVFIYTSHIYLYLNYKLGKLIRNPEIQKKLLFQNKVVRIKWLNLITVELLYDLLCLGISIFQVIINNDSLFARLLELIYLAKIYKIKIFHDRFQNYIIGTSFYVIYNVFYGLFILIILVSYVGCIFYQIDHILYTENYKYQSLLWVNESAWNDIISDSFGVQLLYAIYWSIGTASAAAYGDISASAPPDVVYNILCLYFQGFLFGFYLSRIHSIPAHMIERQNQLLDLFQKFQEHNQQIKSQGEHISQELYFKILCSLEYQENAKKSLDQIQSILPADYIMEIKQHIFQDFIDLNPMNLWSSQALQKKLCMNITEEVTEVGEMLYEYSNINRSDLIYIKDGTIHAYIQIDHGAHFSCHYNEGALINTFGFITNLNIKCSMARLQTYSVLYTIKRNTFKELLSPQNYVYLLSLFNSMVNFDNDYLETEPIGQYYQQLTRKSSDVLLMGPDRKSQYFDKVLKRTYQANIHLRQGYTRIELRSGKRVGMGRKGKVNVGIQCQYQDKELDTDKVFIIEEK